MDENIRSKAMIRTCIRMAVLVGILLVIRLAWRVSLGALTDHVMEGIGSDTGEDVNDPFSEDDEVHILSHSETVSDEKIVYINHETSYSAVIEDDAQLLDEEERQKLSESMQAVTAYGNAAFKTTDSNDQDTESYARQYYTEQFGTDSGTLFLIDMDNRNIWIHSDGAVYKVITTSYANTITDNVYRYASAGDYYECAAKAYEQITDLLKGYKIAQPMKYINNILLALILALLLNYGAVSFFARLRKPGRKELLGSTVNHFSYTRPEVRFVRESRTYNPVSSSSSGGSSGGGGGGGSRSGGGGGHRF